VNVPCPCQRRGPRGSRRRGRPESPPGTRRA
jgi:hypothetical protein